MRRFIPVVLVIAGLLFAGCTDEPSVGPGTGPKATPSASPKATPKSTPAPVANGALPAGKPVGDLSKANVAVVPAAAPVKADGKLDEAIWKDASAVTEFIVGKGKPATQQTRALVAYDKDNLYIAVICMTADTGKLVAKATKHDEQQIWSGDDCVEIYLDANAAKERDFYAFFITPANAVYDRRKVEAWDGKIASATATVKNAAWVVEMAVPWTTIGMKGKTGEKLGLQIARNDRITRQMSYMAPCNDEAKDTTCYPTLELK